MGTNNIIIPDKIYNFRILSSLKSRDNVYFSMLLTLRESLGTSDSALLRVRSKKTTTSPSDALTLKLSGFCTVGATSFTTILENATASLDQTPQTRHSREGRKPGMAAGYRIKSGMTVKLFSC